MSVKTAIKLYALALMLAVGVTALILVLAHQAPTYEPPCASIPNNPYHAVCVQWPGESVQAPLSGHAD